jgi:hypothetical protein
MYLGISWVSEPQESSISILFKSDLSAHGGYPADWLFLTISGLFFNLFL